MYLHVSVIVTCFKDPPFLLNDDSSIFIYLNFHSIILNYQYSPHVLLMALLVLKEKIKVKTSYFLFFSTNGKRRMTATQPSSFRYENQNQKKKTRTIYHFHFHFNFFYCVETFETFIRERKERKQK